MDRVEAPRARDQEVEAAVDRIVADGAPRLHRSWAVTIATGVIAGMEVGLGTLAFLYVLERTGSMLLAAVAFSIGFVALVLGRSELFTEGFLTPVAVVAAKRARVRDAVKLWVGTLAGNLAGGSIIAWFAMEAFPYLHHEAARTGGYFAKSGWSAKSFSLALLAGMAVTLLTRMHNSTDAMGPKLVASVAVAWLLAGLGLFHSILDSLVIFFALESGRVSYGYLDWLNFFAIAVVGNVIGGVSFTTLLRLVQSKGRLIEHRQAAEREDEAVRVPRSGR